MSALIAPALGQRRQTTRLHRAGIASVEPEGRCLWAAPQPNHHLRART